MTALELIVLVNYILFIGLFVAVLPPALRRPSRVTVDTALLFGSIAGVVVVSRLADWFGMDGDPVVTSVVLLLLTAAPLAMLRLVDDFSDVPRWVVPAGHVAYVVVALLGTLGLRAAPELVELVLIAFFTIVGGYAAVAFGTESQRAHGITRRRMRAVALGAGLFIAAVVGLLVAPLTPALANTIAILSQLLALAAVVAFFIGFAPPVWIRRAWREPDLRRFVERSVHLAGVPDDREALIELQRAAADAFGARGASIGLSDPARRVLRYPSGNGGWVEYPDDQLFGGRTFQAQRRLVAPDVAAFDPAYAETYARVGAHSAIGAPVTTEDRRLGVLLVYAERSPIFLEDDLWLLELLASQTAVLLEARTLTTHASELRAREEATRLKEEFLSAAAHDLRTPLTVVLGQAELMERRAARNPATPIDRAGLQRIVREAQRLRSLVTELLDAQRLEEGHAILDLEPADLCELVEAVRDRHAANGAALTVRRPEQPLVSSVDRSRIEQVLDNLVENAVKYGSTESGPSIEVRAVDGEARIAVVDHGVGIPEEERERIFERFYRASNAFGVTDTGLGLGLYICRRIVEEHGGQIWAEETAGGGSTFVVSLPLERMLETQPVDETDRPADAINDAVVSDPGWSAAPGEAAADA